MPPFSPAAWLLLALIGAASVLGLLLAMASSVRNQVQVHEVRQKVVRIRRRYAAEQSGQQQGEIIEVDAIEDGPGPVAEPAATAQAA